ncbi:hypothetical protein [Rhodococcus sp. SGAir0479]|uniref:hypothetical protein n=1 Tax=Rhodococcus sp. SGAir0479 TaxID=2567884 RepID=UPI0010CD0C23|nr:hypothetical protein [Rhodococcus sp. SGAir0479]QCQ90214.1 hypothetical protein E7742_02605 [Rhodococcus sp. SGAir0479]
MSASIPHTDHEQFADAANAMILLTERPTHVVVVDQLRAVRSDYALGRHMLATYCAPGWPGESWLVQFRTGKSRGQEERTLAESCHFWLVDAFDATVAQLESAERGDAPCSTSA